jgi:hypothetical protein
VTNDRPSDLSIASPLPSAFSFKKWVLWRVEQSSHAAVSAQLGDEQAVLAEGQLRRVEDAARTPGQYSIGARSTCLGRRARTSLLIGSDLVNDVWA